jgi:anti-sigma factor RsiW
VLRLERCPAAFRNTAAPSAIQAAQFSRLDFVQRNERRKSLPARCDSGPGRRFQDQRGHETLSRCRDPAFKGWQDICAFRLTVLLVDK